MKTFIMTAECEPKGSAKWFDGFQDGSEFEAADSEAAQDWLNEQCRISGTHEDYNYVEFGPAAKEVTGLKD